MLEQNGVKYGVIAGLGSIIATLLLYFSDPKIMLNFIQYIGWAIYLFCMVKSVSDDRTAAGGFISFKNAFQSSFVVFIIASLFTNIFWYILTNMIDPSLPQLQIDMAVEAMDQVVEAGWMDEKMFDAAVAELENPNNYSLMKILQNYLIGLVGGAIPALIVAAIMKREKPMHIQAQEKNDDINHLVDNE